MYWLVFVIFMFKTDAYEETRCLNVSAKYNYRVATFCERSQISDTQVILDGYYVHSASTNLTCHCVMQTDQHVMVLFNPLNDMEHPLESTSKCESQIDIGSTSLECSEQGGMLFNANTYVNVVLQKRTSTADTRYCIHITTAQKSVNISISCEDVPIIRTTLTTTATTTKEFVSSSANIILGTPTEVQVTSTGNTRVYLESSTDVMTTSSSRYVVPDELSSDYNKRLLTIAVGGGVGGALVLGVIILISYLHRRRLSSKRTRHKQLHNALQSPINDGEDELKDNILYVSSDSVNNCHSIPSEVYKNHSNNDLENTEQENSNELPSQKPAIAPRIKPHLTQQGSGGFSNINYVKHDAEADESNRRDTGKVSRSFKPAIARKPKAMRNRQQELNSFADTQFEQHIPVSSETEGDYDGLSQENCNSILKVDGRGISEKPITDNIYAVVDKSKKFGKAVSINNETESVPIAK